MLITISFFSIDDGQQGSQKTLTLFWASEKHPDQKWRLNLEMWPPEPHKDHSPPSLMLPGTGPGMRVAGLLGGVL